MFGIVLCYILLDFNAWEIQIFLLCLLHFTKNKKTYASAYSITSRKKNVLLLMMNAIILTICSIKYYNDRT